MASAKPRKRSEGSRWLHGGPKRNRSISVGLYAISKRATVPCTSVTETRSPSSARSAVASPSPFEAGSGASGVGGTVGIGEA